ncbi:MAG TPA: carboxymuconolactone decarboxylase family protein, partial [Candidatus Acidoferrales bacterium]|nr:carboxymuconolactone decarboxylase family protein [Candidatus Acidoferrales bacterium]
MSTSEQRKKGIEKFTEVMGFTPPEVEDPFFDATLEHLFPNVWGRGELSRRERRLITLTILMSLGHEGTLRLHLNAATQSGDLSDKDVDELILHVTHYAG